MPTKTRKAAKPVATMQKQQKRKATPARPVAKSRAPNSSRLPGWMEHVARSDLPSHVAVSIHVDAIPTETGIDPLPRPADTLLRVLVKCGNEAGDGEWLDLMPDEVAPVAEGMLQALAILRAGGVIPAATPTGA